MAVTGSNGSSYDLSSNFEPDRTDYGAMLPPEATNALLCLQPVEGTHPFQPGSEQGSVSMPMARIVTTE